MKFFEGVGRGQRRNRLDFGNDPDLYPVPWFLHYPDPGILMVFLMKFLEERTIDYIFVGDPDHNPDPDQDRDTEFLKDSLFTIVIPIDSLE